MDEAGKPTDYAFMLGISGYVRVSRKEAIRLAQGMLEQRIEEKGARYRVNAEVFKTGGRRSVIWF